MKFNRYPDPRLYTTREVTFFAWLPIRSVVGNNVAEETRWLEEVTVAQRFEPRHLQKPGWCTKRFIDKTP